MVSDVSILQNMEQSISLQQFMCTQSGVFFLSRNSMGHVKLKEAKKKEK